MARIARMKLSKVIPADLGKYVRERTNWEQFTKILHEQAFGGKTVVNGNEKTYITQPDIKALEMLVEISYGKLDDADDVLTAIKKDISEQSGPPLRMVKTG